MFQLLIPGPRATTDPALPRSPIAGRANAAVLNQRSKVRSLAGSSGLPTTTGRQPSPPPVRSIAGVRLLVSRPEFEVTDPEPAYDQKSGAPLYIFIVPLNCQSSSTFLTSALFISRLARGRKIV